MATIDIPKNTTPRNLARINEALDRLYTIPPLGVITLRQFVETVFITSKEQDTEEYTQRRIKLEYVELARKRTVHLLNYGTNDCIQIPKLAYDVITIGPAEWVSIYRNPFGRFDIERRPINYTEARGCFWCATKATVATRLLEYRTNPDSIGDRSFIHPGVFCQDSCFTDYHDIPVTDMPADTEDSE